MCFMYRNYSLKNLTTLGMPGTAEYFCTVDSVNALEEALRFAADNNLSYKILGGGSNLFLKEEYIAGVVIKNEIKGRELLGDLVRCGAGEDWDEFVAWTLDKNQYGLENLSAIPGTVGASPIQNIGAYGVEVGEFIHSVEVCRINPANKEIEHKTLNRKDCAFGYRDSVFKRSEGEGYVVTNVIFSLLQKPRLNLGYPDIQTWLKSWLEKNSKSAEDVTAHIVRKAVISVRKEKLPDLSRLGTAGSFFKNPIITQDHFARLKSKYPNIPGYQIDVGDMKIIKVPLAWILDNVCKAKEIKFGPVGVYEKQPLVLVNGGGGTSLQVQALVSELTRLVFEATQIKIEPEVVFWG